MTARRSPPNPQIDGKKLAAIRLRRRMLLQGELAEKTGLSRATISLLETGRRNAGPVTLRKLCEALQCGPEELLKTEGNNATNGNAPVGANRPSAAAASG